MKEPRELTGKEITAIRKLVTGECANYDKHYKCCALLDDYGCYMISKRLADKKLCQYFKQAVLPLDTELERVLTGKVVNGTKPCAVCGRKFAAKGRQAYCSEKCRETGSKAKEREKKRKQRRNMG